jgi:hypothetical protein
MVLYCPVCYINCGCSNNDVENSMNSLSYSAWMDICDEICNELCGLDCIDLPDWTWYAAWENGELPADAVNMAMDCAVDF